MKSSCKKFIRGAAAAEYILVTLSVAIALLTPINAPVGDGRSASVMAIDAIKENYAKYLWAMSVPI